MTASPSTSPSRDNDYVVCRFKGSCFDAREQILDLTVLKARPVVLLDSGLCDPASLAHETGITYVDLMTFLVSVSESLEAQLHNKPMH